MDCRHGQRPFENQLRQLRVKPDHTNGSPVTRLSSNTSINPSHCCQITYIHSYKFVMSPRTIKSTRPQHQTAIPHETGNAARQDGQMLKRAFKLRAHCGKRIINRISLYIVLIPAIIFCSSIVSGQEKSDTLALARNLIEESNFVHSVELLENYLMNHPDNIHALQLLSYTFFRKKDLKKAEYYYNKVYDLYPNQPQIIRDFAYFLYSTEQYDKSQELYKQYLQFDPGNPEALLKLAYIQYDAEQYSPALSLYQEVKALYPSNAEATQMIRHINELRAITARMIMSYLDDDQPLQLLRPTIELSTYRSRLLHPVIGVKSFVDTQDGFSSFHHVTLGNHFIFNKLNLKLDIKGGLYSHSTQNHDLLSMDINLSKGLTSGLQLNGNFKRDYDLHTLQAFTDPAEFEEYKIGFKLDKGDSWLAEASYGSRTYSDDNRIKNIYGWFLSPSLKLKFANFRLGYGYSYSDAKTNNFTNKVDIDIIKEEYEDGYQIEGTYDTYFTPTNQMEHSIISLIALSISKNLFLNFNTVIKPGSTADIPYLYLDDNAGDLFMATGFFEETTTNYDLSGRLDYQAGPKHWLSLEYARNKTFYYTANRYTFSWSVLLYNVR